MKLVQSDHRCAFPAVPKTPTTKRKNVPRWAAPHCTDQTAATASAAAAAAPTAIDGNCTVIFTYRKGAAAPSCRHPQRWWAQYSSEGSGVRGVRTKRECYRAIVTYRARRTPPIMLITPAVSAGELASLGECRGRGGMRTGERWTTRVCRLCNGPEIGGDYWRFAFRRRMSPTTNAPMMIAISRWSWRVFIDWWTLNFDSLVRRVYKPMHRLRSAEMRRAAGHEFNWKWTRTAACLHSSEYAVLSDDDDNIKIILLSNVYMQKVVQRQVTEN